MLANKAQNVIMIITIIYDKNIILVEDPLIYQDQHL